MPFNIPQTQPSSIWYKLFLAIVMCSFVLSPSYCFADGADADRFKFNGFATLGVVRSGTDNLGYRRDITGEGVHDDDWSLKLDTRLGLQGSVRLSAELDAIIQFIIKDKANNGIEESIEWAYLRYRLTQQVTARAGRLGIELFMLSDYRDLGFAYLWARPPIEFYAPIAFDYLDGVDISYSAPLGVGTLRTSFFAGSSDAPVDYSDKDDKLLLNNIFGLMVGWEWEHWRTQLTASSAELDDDIDDSLGLHDITNGLSAASLLWVDAELLSEQLNDNDEGVSYYSLGISYEKNPWFIQSEVMYLDSGHSVLQSYFGRYISVGFRAVDAMFYATIAKGNQTKPRTNIPVLPVALSPVLGGFRDDLQAFYDYNYIDQKTASVGVRWDIRYDLALKSQWDRTWVEEAGGLLWNQKKGSSKEDVVDTYSINLNYIF